MLPKQGAQQALPGLFPGAQMPEGADGGQMGTPNAGMQQGDAIINTNSISSKSPDPGLPGQSKKVTCLLTFSRAAVFAHLIWESMSAIAC